ncbi:TrmB family transcriptional regulator [Candidatus Pacearchaeota archaeon]|nr:TrmB family transcriptional regulator [Candidatus Pacearchaeota archaeon]
MIIKPELVKKIKDYFNLNIYETKVWLALLGKGIASAGEVAEISGVPRSRTYDVLESLEKRGFAIMKLGKPVKYIAVKPNIIIEKLKTNTIAEANDKIKNISKLKETDEYTELEELYTVGIKPIKHEEISGSIRGKSTIYNHIKELLENSKKEVIICTSVNELNNKARFFSLIFDRLKKSNIKMKIALSGDEKEIEKLNKKLRIKAKSISIESKFFISDSEQVLFIISNGKLPEEEIAIWLNTPFFTSALSYLFDKANKEPAKEN